MTSSPPNQLALSERADIHKSCKSLETLVNVLNDYCEATTSIVALQKKLAKALRDTATLKATGEVATNALNSSAIIFDVMSDIDAKFGKIANRECDSICADVRKWFKKLAKEEKAHDDRMNSANNRIKQAGQTYEKKSKKNPHDAGEEHARYINLISMLGPEISQEKYNHALLVNQRHTSTTYNVAACLSRIADIEWVRSCEEVRRFAPIIGKLGEWRSLCEGGWTGSIPQDLPGADDIQQSSSGSPNEHLAPSRSPIPTMERQDSRDPRKSTEQNIYDGRTTSSGEQFPPWKPSNHFPSAGKETFASSRDDQNVFFDPPKAPFAGNEKWSDTVGSITSLSSFPSPPTYFPVPPSSTQLSAEQPQYRPSPQQRPVSTSPRVPPLSASPKSWRAELDPTDDTPSSTEGSKPHRTPCDGDDLLTPPILSDASSIQDKDKVGLGLGPGESAERHVLAPNKNIAGSDSRSSPTAWSPTSRQSLQAPDTPQAVEKSSSANSPGSTGTANSAAYKQQGGYSVDEFGVDRSGGYGQLKLKSVNAAKTQELERKPSSGNTSSIVAAMRSRYTNAAGSSLPTPRNVPRLPLSVNDLASRYQPMDDPSPPRRRAASPIDERQNASPHSILPSQDRSPEGGYVQFPSPSTEANMEELARRRRQREELAEQEQKEKEQVFRDRQLEIEMRTRELERDRAQFLKSREGDTYSDTGHTTGATRPNDISEPHRQYSQFDSPTPGASAGRYSYSTTHLVPPSSSSSMHIRHSRSQSPTPIDDSKSSKADHADICGCATCSASKYKIRNTPSPHDLRPPEPPINLRPEKPKGWMRRLSMPVVGNGFSLDSKKSNPSLRIGLTSPAGGDGRTRRSFELGGVSNRSMSNLARQ